VTLQHGCVGAAEPGIEDLLLGRCRNAPPITLRHRRWHWRVVMPIARSSTGPAAGQATPPFHPRRLVLDESLAGSGSFSRNGRESMGGR